MKLCIVIGKKHHIDLQIFHDETSRDILDLISAQKSLEPKSTQVIYEELPKLQMLRIFEDHESIYEAAKVWLTNSKNTLRYAFKENKYRFINCPEDYLIPKNVVNAQTSVNSLRVKLINDFFPMNGEKGKPLEFSSILYVKEKSRKKWVKKLVLIKAEGVFVAKSDYKKALSEKNPAYTRAAHISDCHMYYGYGWSKKLKAPTDFGFALKNPIIQTKNKNISYFCCETEELFNRWVAVVRTVKYGSILRHNFKYVSNESGKDRIFQIKEGHDRRLHPEKFKGKLGVSSQNSQNPQNSQNTGNFASNQANTPGNHGNAMLQRHQHSQNYDSMNSTQTRQTHLSGTSTDFSQSNQSNQSQAYLAGQAYARRLQSQQNQQFAAPMTQFYEQGQSRNVGAVNDFPPPPPFVHQLENVFQNAKENSGQVNRMNHPSSGSRNSYNSDMSQGQIGLNSNGSNGSGLGHGSPHGMNQNQQFSQNSHQFSQNSTKQTNINLNITNQPVFNLNSTLTRKASANLNKFDHDDTFDSEEDDFEHKLDAMGTLESSVFNPGTVLRQTSYRSENNKIPTEDFQSELARKLGGASATLQRSNTNGAVGGVRNSRNGEVFPPPPPFELPPVPQNFTNKPPPPPRRR